MKILRLVSLTLLGGFVFTLAWLGWISLLEHLASFYPSYQEMLSSPKTNIIGFVIALLFMQLPYYTYQLGVKQKPKAPKKNNSTQTRTESLRELYTPKGILLQILFGIMIIPILIMIQMGFLLIPNYVFSADPPTILERFTDFICQKYNITREIGAYLVIITPSLISACLFYLLGGKKFLSTPRTLFRQNITSRENPQSKMSQPDRVYVSQTITDFIEDKTSDPYLWDDLISTPKSNKTYQTICDYLNSTQKIYPSQFGWCNEKGVEKLKELSTLLCSSAEEKEILKFIKEEKKIK
jgi:hypothetical protein